MGSLRFGGVRFQVFSDDHLPRHMHGKYAGVTVIVEFGPDGAYSSDRRDAIVPPNAKRSDVVHILRTATLFQAQLNRLWEEIHGTK